MYCPLLTEHQAEIVYDLILHLYSVKIDFLADALVKNKQNLLQNLLQPASLSEENDTTPLFTKQLAFALFIVAILLSGWSIWRDGIVVGGASLVLTILFGWQYLGARRGYASLARYLLPLFIGLGIGYLLLFGSGSRDLGMGGWGVVLGLLGLLLTQWFLTNEIAHNLEHSQAKSISDATLLAQRSEEIVQVRATLAEHTEALAALNRQLDQEISEREQAEQALRQNEGLTRAILDYMPDLILQIDQDGTFLDYSPARNMDTIVPPEAFIGHNMADVLPPEVAIPGIQAIQAAIATNEMQFFEYALLVDEQKQIYESRNIPVGDSRVLTIVRDVTDERHAEQAALQTQKLESIGLLAGGIAHDFNNLLTAMLGQNSLALIKLPTDSPARRHLEKSVVSAKRAADLTRQLLAYAGKGQFLIESIDLNVLVREGTGLLETVLPKQASLNLSLAKPLPPIEADRGQIQQIMMNLVINASEAIDEQSGQVWIRTYLQTVSADEQATGLILPEPMGSGTYVCLEVSDTGRGMTQADQERIFDPYYSTKGQGRGLGLSATLGIIRSYQGYLQLQSILGQGSRFQVYFPANAELMMVEETAVNDASVADGTILIIDDEQPVLEAASEIFELYGFQVYMAMDGASGLQLYQQRQQAIDLILLDMHMPVMDGAETFVALRKLDKDVPILMSSGYTEMITSEVLQGEDVDFLQKPYDIDELIRKVQSILA